MIDQAFAHSFANEWVEAWNNHDLEQVLSHYADDFEMHSPVIAQIVGEASGMLVGKQAVGAYWSQALQLLPDLQFELLTVLAGVKHLDVTYLRAARMLGAGNRVIFFQVLLPGSLPATLSGLRVGMGNSWRVLLAAEMVVGTGTGLGFSIVESRWNLDYSAAFACLVVIALIGMVMEYGLFQPIERRTMKRYLLRRDA